MGACSWVPCACGLTVAAWRWRSIEAKGTGRRGRGEGADLLAEGGVRWATPTQIQIGRQ